MQTNNKDFWVFIETYEDGTPKNVGLELLNPGKELAKKQGGELVAIVLGQNTEKAILEASRYGADKVISIEGEEYKQYSNDAYTAAISYLAKKYLPLSMMMGATTDGRELAPRVSCRLQTGLTADCTQLGIEESTGKVSWTRPALGGNLMATILCSDHVPQMGTVRPGVFKKVLTPQNQAKVVRETFVTSESQIRTKILQTIREVDQAVDLESAEIIVAGGRGVGGTDGFELLRDFANSIGATLGCSRAAVEEGWIKHAHQVGQTGKNVAPKLYIACGISGAIQHVSGMSSSGTIVAINKDANAPIFGLSDYGIVGDLFSVVPILKEGLAK